MRRREKRLRPIWPNAGIEAEYRRRLRDLIDELHDSTLYWTEAAWRGDEPEATLLGEDELPSSVLRAALRKLSRRWQRKFDDSAERLARWFAKSVSKRSDAALRKTLRDSGFAVEFKLTRAQRDALRATVEANVSLIRSIPQRYFSEVEGTVMRAAQRGGDLASVTRDLQKLRGVTKSRAKLISVDQSSKATSAMTRVRRLELGLREAEWVHSSAGKQPRHTHVKMHGRRFDVAKGMWDPAVKRWIQPGELIHCRCTSRVVLPGVIAAK